MHWPPSVMFGHYGSTTTSHPKTSICPSAPDCVSQSVATNTAKCRYLLRIVTENAGHSQGLQAFVCFRSKGIVRCYGMIWFWHLCNFVKAGSIWHGFMSVQQSFGRSFSSRIMSNQTSSSQCWIVTMRERPIQHYDCCIATSRYLSI